MPIQNNIVTITEWFARQQKCFEYADKVFLYRTLYLARDHPDYPHAAAKQYACVEGRRETEILDFVKAMGDGHLYEVIRADRPARGFLDVDFVLEDDTKPVSVLKNVLKAYAEFNREKVRGDALREAGEPCKGFFSRGVPRCHVRVRSCG